VRGWFLGLMLAAWSLLGADRAIALAPLGPPIVVGTSTNSFFTFVHSANMNAAGEFLVVWGGFVPFPTPPTTYPAKLYDASGALQTSFSIAGDPASVPGIALRDQDGFVKVLPTASMADPDGVVGRIYDDSGNPIGPEFQVNDHLLGTATKASVEVASNGDFVVAWLSTVLAGNGQLRGVSSGQALRRRRDAARTPVSGEHFDDRDRGLGSGSCATVRALRGVVGDRTFR
jgi:hypothetical protein